MSSKVELVPDAILEMAAKEKGPGCPEARVLFQLRLLRSQDRQVHAFRVGELLMTGPIPDAQTELAMEAIAEEQEGGEETC
jgi:hypothetical protein